MESTYTESTISKLEDKEETIKFDESELEEQLHRGRDKRRLSFHSRHSSASRHKIFPIRESVDPGSVLPTVFRTISHNIDIEKIINQLILAMIMMIKLTKLTLLLKPNLVIIHSIVMILVILLKNSRLI